MVEERVLTPRVVYQGISLGIEPRVASGSVHSLRLSRVRVRESLEGVTVFSYSGFRGSSVAHLPARGFSLLRVST